MVPAFLARAALAAGTVLALSACMVAPDGSLIPAGAAPYAQPGYYPPPAAGYAEGYETACDTAVRVVNRSRYTVEGFQYSPVQAERWGGDRLGDGVLRPGQSTVFRPRYGGRYDFRATFASGGSVETRNVNVCRATVVEVLSNSIRVR